MSKNKKIIYIAKPDTWFKEGTVCELICETGNDSGLFRGTRLVDGEYKYELEQHKIGDERLNDEEGCGYDEFYAIDISDYIEEKTDIEVPNKMSVRERMLEYYFDIENLLFADGYDDAIIGVDENHEKIVYSKIKFLIS